MDPDNHLTLLRDIRAEMNDGFEMIRKRTHDLSNEIHAQNARIAVLSDRSDRSELTAERAVRHGGVWGAIGGVLGGFLTSLSSALFRPGPH